MNFNKSMSQLSTMSWCAKKTWCSSLFPWHMPSWHSVGWLRYLPGIWKSETVVTEHDVEWIQKLNMIVSTWKVPQGECSDWQVVTVRCTGNRWSSWCGAWKVKCWDWRCPVADRPVSQCDHEIQQSALPRCPLQSPVDLEVGGRSGGARIHMCYCVVLSGFAITSTLLMSGLSYDAGLYN